jgi:hypothetical protein
MMQTTSSTLTWIATVDTNASAAAFEGSTPLDASSSKPPRAWAVGNNGAILAYMRRPPVYRFRNLNNGFYLWTADESEKNTIVRTLQDTWVLEGPAYRVNPASNGTPLWRFLNLRGGFYLYTADPAERDNIVRTLSGTWRLEGRAYNVSNASNGRPVWRFRNKQNGTYLLSADPAEKDAIVARLSDTWQLEGPAFRIAP